MPRDCEGKMRQVGYYVEARQETTFRTKEQILRENYIKMVSKGLEPGVEETKAWKGLLAELTQLRGHREGCLCDGCLGGSCIV